MTKLQKLALALATAGSVAAFAPAAVAFPLAQPVQASALYEASANSDQWNHGRRNHHHYDRYGYGGSGYRDSGYREESYRDRSYYSEPQRRSARTWRGDDGRWYCRRNNGTTGLLVGGAVGGLIGNEVAGRGGDRTLGVILGAAGGALLGREIDRGGSRCR